MKAPQDLPVIGNKPVREDPHEPGHWLWQDFFGWHDCLPSEDRAINRTLKCETESCANRGDHTVHDINGHPYKLCSMCKVPLNGMLASCTKAGIFL